MEFVMNLADRITVLEFGAVIAARHAGAKCRPTRACSMPISAASTSLRNKRNRWSRSPHEPALAANSKTSASPTARSRRVHHIDLRVDEGEIVTVIGPNGAGKTTLLCAAMGLLPSRGHAACSPASASRGPASRRWSRAASALVPEKRELFGEMSVEDNLLLGGFSRWRRGERDQRERMEEVFAHLPAPARSVARSWRPRCPAASARCSRSAAR